MRRISSPVLGMVAALALAFGLFACGGDRELLCEPDTYRCGGLEGSIVERCESSGERWETLRDCSETGDWCDEGACVAADDEDG